MATFELTLRDDAELCSLPKSRKDRGGAHAMRIIKQPEPTSCVSPNQTANIGKSFYV
jgi:hypothetical protein